VNQSVCFDNSLKEITPDLLKCRKGIQQGSVLYTSSFISNFHCRYELSKAENDKNPSLSQNSRQSWGFCSTEQCSWWNQTGHLSKNYCLSWRSHLTHTLSPILLLWSWFYQKDYIVYMHIP